MWMALQNTRPRVPSAPKITNTTQRRWTSGMSTAAVVIERATWCFYRKVKWGRNGPVKKGDLMNIGGYRWVLATGALAMAACGVRAQGGGAGPAAAAPAQTATGAAPAERRRGFRGGRCRLRTRMRLWAKSAVQGRRRRRVQDAPVPRPVCRAGTLAGRDAGQDREGVSATVSRRRAGGANLL